MPIDALRRTIAPVVDSLTIPSPWSLPTFVAGIGRARGRPIFLLPTDMSEDQTGLWIATAQADYIAHEQRTGDLHRDTIVLHELGHLLLNLPGCTLQAGAGGRYPDPAERAAEVFATLVLQRAGRKRPPEPSPQIRAVLATFDLIGPPASAADVGHRPRVARRHRLHGLAPAPRTS